MKIVGEFHESYVKLVKVWEEFIWHDHRTEDERFLVIEERLLMRLRDCKIWLEEGEFLVAPTASSTNQ